MTYKVVRNFTDLRGDGHEYNEGDKYPHTGSADPDRVKVLITPTTQRGALIEEVEEVKEPKEPKEAKAPAPKRKKKED